MEVSTYKVFKENEIHDKVRCQPKKIRSTRLAILPSQKLGKCLMKCAQINKVDRIGLGIDVYFNY